MTETEIIKLVFGLFLGVGGGVLLLLAFTVGYRYLVMEQRCTCRTNGTVTGYSAVCYGGENSAVHLPVVRSQRQHRRLITATPSAENMKRTAKAFIIPTETMKHLPGQRNRKESMTKMHTLSEADLQHSQRLVSLSETVRCRVPIFIF